MRFLIKFSQYFVGLLFIISGGIKANDALGFSYKLEEYFDVFHQIMTSWDMPALASLMNFFSDLALPMAMFICVFEIVLGLAIILGVRMKFVMWNMLLMIIFFTWLTGYTATCDPLNAENISCVTDCGCFGDAIPLTPTQSFIKDLILLVFILILFIKHKEVKPLLGQRESNILLLLSIVFPTIFTVYTYRHLPVKDFRAYKPGVNLMEAMTGKAGVSQFFYTLKDKKTGEVNEFEAFPKDWQTNYDYVDYQQKEVVAPIDPEITDFGIYDDVLIDQKDIYVNDSTITLILVSKGLSYLGDFSHKEGVINGFVPFEGVKEKLEPLAELSKGFEALGHHFIALCSNGSEEMDEFRNEMQMPFSFFSGDEKMIKTIIRSNPGLMLVKNGVIIRKWHINDCPTVSDVEELLK